jgi:hypothetical protein
MDQSAMEQSPDRRSRPAAVAYGPCDRLQPSWAIDGAPVIPIERRAPSCDSTGRIARLAAVARRFLRAAGTRGPDFPVIRGEAASPSTAQGPNDVRPPRTPTFAGPGGIDLLEYELVQEKAATLSRIGKRLQAALDDLKSFDAAHGDAAPPDADRARRDELVAAAGEALWYYVIQREVCGLRDSEAVMRHLGVPREVRLRMGYTPRRTEG